ncbi:MAG: hypothetical protein ABSC21_19470 [Terriglobia bacterium]|jgi:hypothetical protein
MALTLDRDLTGQVIQHLNVLTKSMTALNGSHDRLHEAHDDLFTAAKLCDKAHRQALLAGTVAADDNLDRCHKAHMEKHEAARLRRVNHKVAHKTHTDALTQAVESLQKLLGGGAATALTKPASEGPEPGLKADRLAQFEKNHPSQFDLLAQKVQESKGLEKHESRTPPNSQNPMLSGGVHQAQAPERIHKSFFERQTERALVQRR